MPGKVDASIWEQRSAGFLAGVADSGLDPDTVRQLRPGDCRSADGEQIGQDLLASPDSLPSAVFCHSDELAFGLIASLRRGGVHCPQDISVAGFDDHPMAHLWDLTTVDQHAYAQGVRAAQALLGMLGLSSPDTEAQLPATERLSVELIIRDSTSPSILITFRQNPCRTRVPRGLLPNDHNRPTVASGSLTTGCEVHSQSHKQGSSGCRVVAKRPHTRRNA